MGLTFLEALFHVPAIILVASGVLLTVFETGGRGAPFRGPLTRFWTAVAEAPALGVGRLTLTWLLRGGDSLVAWTGATERKPGFSLIVLPGLLVVIPAMALVNALMGGSSFLVSAYGVLFAGVLVLLVAGEIDALAPLNALLAGAIGLALFVLAPLYVSQAFIEAVGNHGLSHAVLESLLVTPFLMLTVHGGLLFLEVLVGFWWGEKGTAPGLGWLRRGLGVLPLSFFLFHVLLLIAHISTGQEVPPRGWVHVLVPMAATGLSFALTMAMLELVSRRRVPLVALVAAIAGAWGGAAMAAGGVVGAGPDLLAPLGLAGGGPAFWVAQMALLPLWALIAALVVTHAAKVLQGAARGRAAARPFVATGALLWIVAALTWGLAAAV